MFERNFSHCIEEIQYKAEYLISYFDFCNAPYASCFKAQILNVSGNFFPGMLYQTLNLRLPSQQFTQKPAPPQDIALITALFILQILDYGSISGIGFLQKTSFVCVKSRFLFLWDAVYLLRDTLSAVASHYVQRGLISSEPSGGGSTLRGPPPCPSWEHFPFSQTTTDRYGCCVFQEEQKTD